MRIITLSILAASSVMCRLPAAETNPSAPPTPLTLAEADKIALQLHPQVRAADYRTLAAQEAAKEARAGYFPTVNAFATAVGASDEGTRILAGGLNNPSIYDRAAGGVAANQLLTDFGHTANLAASSRYQAQAETENARATREQVLLQVDVNYLAALEARAVLRVAHQTFETRQLLLDQVSLLASNKLKSELDVSFARVSLEESRLLLEQAQNKANGAMTSLSTAIGYSRPRDFVLAENTWPFSEPTNDISSLVETALVQRPELMSLRHQENASERYARSQRDARLPKIEAIGVAGAAPTHDSHLPDNYAAAGVQLSLPLFAGGYYQARQRQAEFKAKADSEQLRAAEDYIIRDVHLTWLDLTAAKEQVTTTEQLVQNATEAYDLAQARYKIGSSSIIELSQAQLNLTSAQIGEANARYNLLIQEANLNYQTGALH